MNDRYLVKAKLPWWKRWRWADRYCNIRRSMLDAIEEDGICSKAHTFKLVCRLREEIGEDIKTKVVRLVPLGTLKPQKWGVRRESDGAWLHLVSTDPTHVELGFLPAKNNRLEWDKNSCRGANISDLAKEMGGVVVRLKRERKK